MYYMSKGSKTWFDHHHYYYFYSRFTPASIIAMITKNRKEKLLVMTRWKHHKLKLNSTLYAIISDGLTSLYHKLNFWLIPTSTSTSIGVERSVHSRISSSRYEKGLTSLSSSSSASSYASFLPRFRSLENENHGIDVEWERKRIYNDKKNIMEDNESQNRNKVVNKLKSGKTFSGNTRRRLESNY